MRQVLACLLDGGALDEFQPDVAREMICGHAHIEGRPVAVIANQRGIIKGQPGERPRFGGIIYTESAEKVAYFIETASRERLPILFVQDVSGFMVGPEAEHSGIIRAGARFVEAMATAVVPKIVLTVNHASGAGLLRDGGPGVRSRLHPLLAHRADGGDGRRVGGDGGARGRDREGPAGEARAVAPRCKASIESMRADYEQQLDARYAAARGFVDAIVTPEETRDQLAFVLRVCANYAGPAPRSVRAAAARRGLGPLSHASLGWLAAPLVLACAPSRPSRRPPRQSTVDAAAARRSRAGDRRRSPSSGLHRPRSRTRTGGWRSPAPARTSSSANIPPMTGAGC